jgi:hypothetical protein
MWRSAVIAKTENGRLYTVCLTRSESHSAGSCLTELLRQGQKLLEEAEQLPLVRQLSGEACGILVAEDLIWKAWHQRSEAVEFYLQMTPPPKRPTPGSGPS